MSKANINDFTHIDESIVQILGTKKGERTMEQEFYSDIDTAIFEPSDENLVGLLEFQVREALERLDTRINLVNVEVLLDGGAVYVIVSYTIPEFNNKVHDLKVKVGDLSGY